MTHTAVVSYHTNRYTCGVARFNHSLAGAMSLEIVSLEHYLRSGCLGHPIISLKLEEIDKSTQLLLSRRLVEGSPRFDLLLHGVGGSELELTLCKMALRVFAASREIANEVRLVRPDVVAVFAPGAKVLPRQTLVDCTMLTFGMAHKIQSEGYRRLASILVDEQQSFRLEISTALHEGGTFDESFFNVSEEISRAFNGNVCFVGFLADAEVSARLRSIDVLVAFFPRGVRENNTTVLSAMCHGCPVITNLDADSPSWMIHDSTIFDVGQLVKFPSKSALRRIGQGGQLAASEYTFEALAEILKRRV